MPVTRRFSTEIADGLALALHRGLIRTTYDHTTCREDLLAVSRVGDGATLTISRNAYGLRAPRLGHRRIEKSTDSRLICRRRPALPELSPWGRLTASAESRSLLLLLG